jgi:AcrR family transcriptional regulator
MPEENNQEKLKNLKKEALRMSNAESKALTRSCVRKAMAALMQTKDYDKITVTEIIEKAGISRAGFYRNYHGKDDVLQDMIDRQHQKLQHFWDKIRGADDPKPVFQHFFERLKQNKRKVKMVNDMHRRMPVQRWPEHHDFLSHYEAQRKTAPEAYYTALAFQAGMRFIVSAWVRNGMAESPEQMGAICADLYQKYQNKA